MNTASTDEEDAWAMKRLVGGQGTALNDLMDRHAERLFHFLLRNLRSEEDAADLAQEAFVRVYLHRNHFNPSQRFSTWLYAIASNLLKDRYRWRSRHPESSIESEHPSTGATLRENLSENGPLPSDDIEGKERADTVRRAVQALPDDLRLPLILAEYEERSHDEIGRILGCSTKAVETRIYRAKGLLRVQLSDLITRA